MFCRKCGTSILEGARFCNKCGCPLVTADTVTPPVSQSLPRTGGIAPGPDTAQPAPTAAAPEIQAPAPQAQPFTAQTQAPSPAAPAPRVTQIVQPPSTPAPKKQKKTSPVLNRAVLYILIIALTASATAGVCWLLSPKYETIYVLTETITESDDSRSVEIYEYNELGQLIFESYEHEFYDSRGQVESTSASLDIYVYGEDESGNIYYHYLLSDSPYDSVTEGTFTVNEDRQLTSTFLDFGYGYTSKKLWEYDEDGNLLERIYLNDGELRSRLAYTYNADGNETSLELYIEGKLVTETEKIYDGDKITRIESVNYDENGKVESRGYGIAEYDSHGNMIELTYYNYDGDSETARYEYIYDDHGNRLEIIQYRDGEEVSHVYNTYKAIKLPKD